MTKKQRSMELDSISDMENPGRLKYLSAIDRLRELGVNEDISLPQLVVVGDQSSGKSSLLEALTGLSFPVASDLCTRFATQIVLRRAAEQSVKVSILPGLTAQLDEDVKAHFNEFARTLEHEEFGAEEFAEILNEAAEYMGLPGPQTLDIENLEKRFSEDILKIELSGPEHHHLSVVDVPGLFHNPTKYQTLEDLSIIRDLITDYIGDRRTIILAVMDARNQLANQEVFQMARTTDPEGRRTVGIVTKCDALQSGDEQSVLKIAQNKVAHLRHGWFAVRNRSTKDIQDGVTIPERHRKEADFFSKLPWKELDRDRVGISALKTFLGGLLYEHIRKEFPSLIHELEGHFNETQKRLGDLGPSRCTAVKQRQYLMRIATTYQHHVNDALKGNYDAALDSRHPLKLRMHIRNINDDFAEELRLYGHTRVFRTVDDVEDEAFRRDIQDGNSAENIYEWIRDIYRDSRGAELPGTVNPAVMENLFRQQSSAWQALAVEYLRRVQKAIRAYNESIFPRLMTDEEVRTEVETLLQPDIANAQSEARAQLNQILKDERGGILQTVNHYFADTLQNIREERVIHRLRKAGFEDGYLEDFSVTYIAKAAHLSNEDQAVNDIHDALKAYYKVALKRFMDNIVMAVVERILLGPDGPVKIFSPELIGRLSDEELARIAAESYITASARSEIEHRARRLEEALRIAKSV